MASSTYLNRARRDIPTSNSFTSTSFDSFNTNSFSSTWDNTAHVIIDPNITDGYKITVNKNYLPSNHFESSNISVSSIKTPPGYLTAHIAIYKGSTKTADIPVLFPGTLSNSISASFARSNPVGSNKPIIAYEHTDAESFPFNFVALADYLPVGYTSLNAYIEALKEMVRPSYSGNTVLSPHVILYYADIVIECVCTNINVQYADYYGTNSFVKADISCEFTKI